MGESGVRGATLGECEGGRSGQPGGAARGQEGKEPGKAIASGDTSSLAARESKS